jgi:hypothetical protein
LAKKPDDGFTEEEREAMKARAAEMKKARTKPSKADGEADILAKIAEMTEPDKSLATRIHALVRAAAPSLTCKTWYGMPAYARGEKVVCFFQAAGKFKSRYATFGFSDQAHLDDGNFWPNAFAVTKLSAADEAVLTALVKKAAG